MQGGNPLIGVQFVVVSQLLVLTVRSVVRPTGCVLPMCSQISEVTSEHSQSVVLGNRIVFKSFLLIYHLHISLSIQLGYLHQVWP